MTTTRFGWRLSPQWLALAALGAAWPLAAPVRGEPGVPAGRDGPGLNLADSSAASPVFRVNSAPANPPSASRSIDDSVSASGDRASSGDAVSAWLEQTVKSPSPEGTGLVHRGRAEPATAESKSAPSGSVTSPGFLSVLWPLLIVLILITGTAVVIRRWLWRANRVSAGGALDILARHYLSPKQSLCLLRLGRRVLLVGVTPERISTVADFNDPDEVAAIVAGVERGKPKSFTAMFARLAEREWGKGSSRPAETEKPAAAGQLAAAGANVRDLLGRVRGLSASAGASAEPTS